MTAIYFGVQVTDCIPVLRKMQDEFFRKKQTSFLKRHEVKHLIIAKMLLFSIIYAIFYRF